MRAMLAAMAERLFNITANYITTTGMILVGLVGEPARSIYPGRVSQGKRSRGFGRGSADII